jgi:hypothetical protein
LRRVFDSKDVDVASRAIARLAKHYQRRRDDSQDGTKRVKKRTRIDSTGLQLYVRRVYGPHALFTVFALKF